MLRRLPRIAAVLCLLSLLACVGLAWLWWRSYRTRDAREFQRRGVRWEIATDQGRVLLGNGQQQRLERAPLTEAEQRFDDARRRARDAGVLRFDAIEVEGPLYRAQLDYAARAKTPAVERSVSFAVPVAAAALPPLLWLAAYGRRRRLIRRRNRLGLCLRCGYDLRGSPPGRCSECGAAGERTIPVSD
jgi:hypothetical protein